MAGCSNWRDVNGGNCDEKCKQKCNGRVDSVKQKSFGQGIGDVYGMSSVMFHQLVLVLLRRLYAKNVIRHIPVSLRGGRSVDLFKLFYLVREKGGFETVSREKLWGLVAKSLDLDFGFSTSLQMVYYNNLGDLDHWLDGIGKDWNSKKMCYEYGMNYDLLSIELEKRFRALVVDDFKLLKIEKGVIPAGSDKIRSHIDVDLRENLRIREARKKSRLFVNGNNSTFDDDENLRETEADKSVGRPAPDSLVRDSNRKRKRKGWKEMLSWLSNMAKNPSHSLNGIIWNSSNRKENGVEEYHSLALLAREALLERKYPNSNDDGCCSHQKQKIHPSIYDDPASSHTPGLRFSRRVPALAKSPKFPCCISSLIKESKSEDHSKAVHPEADTKDKEETTPDSPASCSSEPTSQSSSDEQPVQKRVKVGPIFQVKIPSLTENVSESDSKWLGTRVWPPNNHEQKTVTVKELVFGRGRPDICDCPYPGSVECVRFHIAENNMKLKRELGRAFYQWRFDRLGEVVSLSWTPQEEEEFKVAMCADPLSTSKPKPSFPKKTRQELVNYYFNVFLQRKRSYQNRVTPNSIGTDDELSYFGSVGGLYGHSATSISGTNPGICTQNGECSLSTPVKARNR